MPLPFSPKALGRALTESEKFENLIVLKILALENRQKRSLTDKERKEVAFELRKRRLSEGNINQEGSMETELNWNAKQLGMKTSDLLRLFTKAVSKGAFHPGYSLDDPVFDEVLSKIPEEERDMVRLALGNVYATEGGKKVAAKGFEKKVLKEEGARKEVRKAEAAAELGEVSALPRPAARKKEFGPSLSPVERVLNGGDREASKAAARELVLRTV